MRKVGRESESRRSRTNRRDMSALQPLMENSVALRSSAGDDGRTTKREDGMKALEVSLVVAIIYVSIAFGVYRFKHPELTETQLFLKAPDALLFR